MGYSREEQETSIVWDEEKKIAHIYATSPASMRKLDRLVEQFPAVYRRTWAEETDGRITAAKYEMPSRLIRFGKPPSAAQIETAKRNAARMNSAPQKAP